MQLRYYQAEAVLAAYDFLRSRPGENPCIVLPTGGGKTPVLATMCNDAVSKWGGRVLVLSHVKELVEQSAETLRQWYPGLDVGVYSAGVGSRDTDNDVVIAGVQSVANRGFELCGSRPFNLVLVDEAHRIPTEGDGQYVSLMRDLLIANPKVRVIGLTATHYRMKSGYVCGPDHFLNDVCYEVSVKELISQGFLCRLVSKQSHHDADLSSVSVRRGEYSQAEMEDAFEEIVETAVQETIERGKERNSVLVFCAGVDHAIHVADEIRKAGETCELVIGELSAAERSDRTDRFKRGEIKYLVNVNVLTEGFNATCVDMVVLLRATLSPGLFYQMVGRGLRLHPGKEDCLVLDFGGNTLRHGCIDEIKIKSRANAATGEAPSKVCPKCDEVLPISHAVCIQCGHKFPEPEAKPRHEGTASDAAILSDDVKPVKHTIDDIVYSVHVKRGADEGTPRTMRVTYYTGIVAVADEWVCVEHSGWARENALRWWARRSSQFMPNNVDDSVEIGNRGGLAHAYEIEVWRKPGERYSKIISHKLDDRPEPVDLDQLAEWADSDEELPF